MTKQGFIKFSFESEETIDIMLDLFNDEWIFLWDDLKDIIVNNSISVINIIDVLELFECLEIKITEDKFDFFRFICKMHNKGFNENHIVSQYLHLRNIK